VQAWSDQISIARKERLIDNFLQKKRSKSALQVEAQDKIEEAAFHAATAEDEGNRDSAIEHWQRVKQNNSPIWNLVADKHLSDLLAFEEIEKHFEQRYGRIRAFQEEQPVADPGEKKAFLAWRAEHCAIPDHRLARSLFRSLQRETAGAPQQHRWFVYAAYNAKELAEVDQKKEDIKAEAEKQLQMASEKLKAKRIRPEDALLILDILALYESDGEMQSLVEEARQLRDESLKQ
jgi:hypothetical protein